MCRTANTSRGTDSKPWRDEAAYTCRSLKAMNWAERHETNPSTRCKGLKIFKTSTSHARSSSAPKLPQNWEALRLKVTKPPQRKPSPDKMERKKTLLLHLIPPNDCEHFWPLKVRECLRVLCVSSVWGNDSPCLCTNTAQSLQNCRPGLCNPAPLHFNPLLSGFLMVVFYFDSGPSNLVQLQNYEGHGWASKQATWTTTSSSQKIQR